MPLRLCSWNLRADVPPLSPGGGNLNNITRMELMQKLSRSDRPAIDLPKTPMFVVESCEPNAAAC